MCFTTIRIYLGYSVKKVFTFLEIISFDVKGGELLIFEVDEYFDDEVVHPHSRRKILFFEN